MFVEPNRTRVPDGSADAGEWPSREGIAAGDTLTTADGTRATLSPITPDDGADFRAFVEKLSPEARNCRFHDEINCLSQRSIAELTQIDQRRHVGLALRPADGTEVVGEARYILGADGKEAEFAVAIAEAWRHRGIGRSLMCILERHAGAFGVRRFYGIVHVENQPMKALLRGLGYGIGPCEDDGTCVVATREIGDR